MKNIIRFAIVSVFVLALFACANASPKTDAANSADSLTIDAAIKETASYFAQRLPQGAKIALVPFDAPSGPLSDYVFEELWTRFEDSRKFVMVDRRNLERIENEIRHQYQTGRVDDSQMVSVTKQYGAEILVYGQMSVMGAAQGAAPEYRMTVYASDVEKASSSQRSFVVRQDNRLASLLKTLPEDEIDRAVYLMARALDKKTVITVGRISYAGTQTVSGLSAWLKNNIISGAQKHRDKLQIATDSESARFVEATRALTVEEPVSGIPVQAIVQGTFSPLDKDAEVSLQLISTNGRREVLAASRFVIPASELQRRKLSLLPEKNDDYISKAEFETKQKAVDPYAGKNNKWAFTVTPNVLDGIYYDNDLMSLQVYSARDCYFRIIQIDVNGVPQIIYPRVKNDNNFIRAGQVRQIPDNASYRLHAPFGEEIILVAAYDKPFLESSLGSGIITVESITRGLTVESDNRTVMSPSATAKLSYTILPR